MSSILHRKGTTLGLVLVLWGGVSWGQLPLGNDISDGAGNTAGGTGALSNNTTGGINTAYGNGALGNNTTGYDNTAYGNGVLESNSTGNENTASGVGALSSNSTGSRNTASGFFALGNNATANENTASGYYTLFLNSTGSRNTASGYFVLMNNTTGSGNIALGSQAGFQLLEGSANIYLGHLGENVESRTMRLGQEQTRTFIAGVAAVPVRGSPVFISDTGQLGTPPSSARYKRDIEPMGAHSQRLFQLRPVTFRYRQDELGERQYGLIAEEVVTVYPELVTRGATGEIESVRYEALIPLVLHELQHQQAQVAELRAQNAALAARLEWLEEAAARAAALTSR